LTWALLLIGLLAALDYWRRVTDAPGLARSAVKTVSTAALALAALSLSAPWLIALAFALASLGDLALSRKGAQALQAGLGAFALAHIAFYVAFRQLPGALPGFDLDAARWAGVVALILLALSTALWLLPFTGGMKRAVAAYVAIITVMGFAALHLTGGFVWVIPGVALFLASDLILAVQIFRMAEGTDRHRLASRLVWPPYWGGQVVIFLGIVNGLGLWSG